MATLCKFFAKGICKNGDSCKFIHQHDPSAQNEFRPVTSRIPQRAYLQPSPFHPYLIGQNKGLLSQAPSDTRATVPCKFLARPGGCRNPSCPFLHAIDHQTVEGRSSQDPESCENGRFSSKASSDTRGTIPCKFVTYPGGCRNDACPFLHATDGRKVGKKIDSDLEVDENEERELEDDFTRELSGALVRFNEFGHVSKLSLPTDFSLACITGLASGTTPQAVVQALGQVGFNITVDCVRILGVSETKAMVEVEDPSFAHELSTKLKDLSSPLSATPVPINVKRSNYRKVHLSWHKPTRSVCLNFGNGEIANRVAMKFSTGSYKCLGQPVKSTTARSSPSRRGRDTFGRNPVAWKVTLSDVPSDATTEDIQKSIKAPYDKPRQVEMGPVSYTASDAEVSVEVRSCLEQYGLLESFYLAPMSTGKRVKAAAWFQDESDAMSACSLNKKSFEILGKGKLTVTRIQSTKVKVSTAIYLASKRKIEEESNGWKKQHLMFNVYHDALHRFTTLKIEGEVPKDVATARKTLDDILSGEALMDGQNFLWDSALSSNGSSYKKLKSIGEEFHAVIIRDKSKRQLRYYGPSEKLELCARRIIDMLQDALSTNYEIDLSPVQFSWAIQGGLKSIEQAIGKNVAVFNVVLRKIIINGTHQQYETALAIMNGKRAVELHPQTSGPPQLQGDCPICFCEADNPIQTSCKHTYCQECFEECCKSAASTSKTEFQVKCQGDEGICTTVFTLRELKDHLSSSVFDVMLESSFEEYIQRHPEKLRYCPTPDCGYVYRNTTAQGLNPRVYTCSNCLEPLCTSCHARHGNYRCEEYKDIASGGYEALERLKKELNIKDCPKCSTPMEKTEGCNHMTCGGCKAHIC